MSSQNQIISKSYLTGLITKCGIFFTIGLLLTGIILYFSAHQPLGPSYSESFARLIQLKKEILLKSIFIYFILMALTIGGVVFITLIYSHRVVGPMVGLTRITRQIAARNLTQNAVLRKKDAIKPMANALNSMIGSYKKKILQLNASAAAIKTIVEKTDAAEHSNELITTCEQIKDITDSLKL